MTRSKKILLSVAIIFLCLKAFSQDIPYGNNPAAGHYVDIDGTKIYYEIYGTGKPLVMLHGGVYGYIDEFTPFIPKLAENFQVICIATRGHGKSEMGKDPFTYKQRADDAYKVIRSINKRQRDRHWIQRWRFERIETCRSLSRIGKEINCNGS